MKISNPFILNRADPHISLHDGQYHFTASVPEYDRIVLRRSPTLAGLVDASERLAYGYDNSRRMALPQAVALPVSEDEVVALVRACRELRLPLTVRGRGTNTTGASVPVGRSLCTPSR